MEKKIQLIAQKIRDSKHLVFLQVLGYLLKAEFQTLEVKVEYGINSHQSILMNLCLQKMQE